MRLLSDKNRINDEIYLNKSLLKTEIGQSSFILILRKIAELENEMKIVNMKIKSTV